MAPRKEGRCPRALRGGRREAGPPGWSGGNEPLVRALFLLLATKLLPGGGSPGAFSVGRTAVLCYLASTLSSLLGQIREAIPWAQDLAGWPSERSAMQGIHLGDFSLIQTGLCLCSLAAGPAVEASARSRAQRTGSAWRLIYFCRFFIISRVGTGPGNTALVEESRPQGSGSAPHSQEAWSPVLSAGRAEGQEGCFLWGPRGAWCAQPGRVLTGRVLTGRAAHAQTTRPSPVTSPKPSTRFSLESGVYTWIHLGADGDRITEMLTISGRRGLWDSSGATGARRGAGDTC